MPRVSVIVPVYNAGRFLKEALSGILNQTLHDIEFIFIDDGSTDNSYNILTEYAGCDERIRLYRKNNEGPGVARNYGIALAKGEYLLFLDADDFFERDMAEIMVRAAERENADIVICRARIYNELNGSEKLFQVALRDDLLPKTGKTFSPQERHDNLFQITGAFVWNKLFRASFIERYHLRFAAVRLGEDMAMLLPALVLAHNITVTDEELVKYRIYNNDSLYSVCDGRWKEVLDVLSYLENEFIRLNVYEKVEKTYLNRMLSTICGILRRIEDAQIFDELYAYLKKEFAPRFQDKQAGYFYDKTDFMLLQCFLDSSSALSFLLKYRKMNLISEAQKTEYADNKYWIFPFDRVPQGCKVLLYGAGDMGQDYFIQVQKSGWCQIAQWVDAHAARYRQKSYPVDEAADIKTGAFDCAVVCLVNAAAAESVKAYLMRQGIPGNKIVLPVLSGNKNVLDYI